LKNLEVLSLDQYRQVHEILASLNSLEWRYDSRATEKIDNDISNAKSVITDRVAMPTEAGTVDPLPLLPPERAKVLADLVKLREPEELWPQIPTACHRVQRNEERRLCLKLVKARMAVLVPDEELPRDRHGRLLGGLFTVETD